MRPPSRLAVTALAAAALAACQGAESPGGQEQPAPDTQLEEPAPNPGREGIESPDAGGEQPTE